MDETDASVMSGNTAAEALVAQMDGGMTLHADGHDMRDLIESGVDNDTYTGTSATVHATDMPFEDASTTDHDTLNITNNDEAIGVRAISVRGVEYVNIDSGHFQRGLAGTAHTAKIDLSGIMGAKVTISSDKLGYDGIAVVNGVGDNTIILGDNITDVYSQWCQGSCL